MQFIAEFLNIFALYLINLRVAYHTAKKKSRGILFLEKRRFCN